jgi:hypothetical protein
MIRLRKINKTSYDVPLAEVPFVEIVNDLDGSVMKLIMQPEKGKVLIVEPNTPDAERYEALMRGHGVKFTDLVIYRK